MHTIYSLFNKIGYIYNYIYYSCIIMFWNIHHIYYYFTPNPRSIWLKINTVRIKRRLSHLFIIIRICYDIKLKWSEYIPHLCNSLNYFLSMWRLWKQLISPTQMCIVSCTNISLYQQLNIHRVVTEMNRSSY